ncbi:MAG: tRNA 2-thiocytidine biosynthesis protein TtcA [Clostridia bacterium]|jgi:tRNA(Ile)-lysidine synthetase-like protein|nr:tRNA 2-thiocytidine biosynthesis protein TtcA [Clostridia bacterium]MDN5322202.1 tRNA 2-thiocytidine biosynthesis protein TtcA [Clostridia bacterium]
MNKNYSKWFLSKVQKAIKKYNLIENGDKVAVGLSGGKDSTALLYILWLLKKYSYLNFELFGVHIDMGWTKSTLGSLPSFCREKNISLIIENTNIVQAIMPENKLINNPCSLCSYLKRGALTNLAQRYNFSKIALGHHSDDVAETLFMNILQGGNFKVFPPRIDYLDKGISIIRPLVYIEEKTLAKLCKLENLPVIPSPCPADGNTERQNIKNLISEIKKTYPQFSQKVVQSLDNLNTEFFWNR